MILKIASTRDLRGSNSGRKARKTMMRLPMLLTLGTAVVAAGFGQPAGVPVASPVPIWTGSADFLPPDLRSQAVFLDPTTDELVVVLDRDA